MKCQVCDCVLTDYETTRKDSDGTYPDVCGECDSNLDFDLSDYYDVLGDSDVDNPLDILLDDGDYES